MQRRIRRQHNNTHQMLDNPMESTTEVRSDDALISNGIGVSVNHNDGILRSSGVGVAAPEMALEAGKFVKRNNTHLIAKALGTDTDVLKIKGYKRRFFDCNICLTNAREPILTQCGHLFCWSCFYHLSYVHLNVKECPACMGEVTDASVIPIYGNGNNTKTQKSKLIDSGSKVPPRPGAQRVESLRQKVINRRPSSSVIDLNIRVYNRIVEMEERSRSEENGERWVNQSFTSQALPVMQAQNNQHHDFSQVSRRLSQGSASLSFLSSAMNSAVDSVERLVDNLEDSIHRCRMRTNYQRQSGDIDRNSFSSITAAAVQTNQILDNNEADVDLILGHRPSSSFSSYTVLPSENQRIINVGESSSVTPISSSSTSRRAECSRNIELQNR
ncbi:uncharacterized protein LOC126659691 [Mercurialis annua]|uniref:uncharacterized protein LOC126659691 n=1 Tax=Mercurialis annua TaxID=3986 RepID=UPI00215E41A6|nr:uncharacterized protein LOC126659691 [Mercurialis annua]XP_055960195.1 uncharacterized protein LOC126659691 [Mercurialis annua]XP_055960196.1 uncharacterized protein LOC126659691 [Mercurialis annua]XP_055960197.1 uncharacterized protein LOC126659691 [Mercurialis annua]